MKIQLRAAAGTYGGLLVAARGGGGALFANGTALEPETWFEVLFANDLAPASSLIEGREYILRATAREQNVCADGNLPRIGADAGIQVCANRPASQQGPWERWVYRAPGAFFSVWHHVYLTVEVEAPYGPVTARSASLDAWQRLAITSDAGGGVGGGVGTPGGVVGIPTAIFADFLNLYTPIGRETWNYAIANEKQRKASRQGALDRGHTHYCLTAISDAYDACEDDTEALVRSVRELHADALGVFLTVSPEDKGVSAKYSNDMPKLVAGLKRIASAFTSAGVTVEHVAMCPEFDQPFPNFTADHVACVKAVRALFGSAGIWMHYNTGIWGPPGKELAFWKSMKAVGATGFAYQYNPKIKPGPSGAGFSVSEQTMKSETDRLAPVFHKLGLKFLTGEHDWLQSEALGIEHGGWGIEHGADGCINGGPPFDRTPPEPLPANTVDALDPKLIAVYNNAGKRVDFIMGWPITSKLSVSFPKHDQFAFRHTKTGLWKKVPGGSIEANGWVAYFVKGRWIGRSLDYWAANQPFKSLDPPRPIWAFPQDGWKAKAGETVYCWMTGPARTKVDGGKERTAIEKVIIPT